MGRNGQGRSRRGSRRAAASPWRIEAIGSVDIPMLDDGTAAVHTAPLEDVLAAFDRLPDGSWSTMRDLIRPVFHRRRPFSFPMEFVSMIVPPGVSIGFAADVGPSFAHVHQGMLDEWAIDLDTLAACAFENLRQTILHRDPGNLVREPVGGVPTIAYQSGEGWASTLLLVPDLIEDVLGPGDRLFIAPMRDLLIDLPPGVDLGFASWLAGEFEALDPNSLCLEGFRYEDGELSIVPLERGAVPA